MSFTKFLTLILIIILVGLIVYEAVSPTGFIYQQLHPEKLVLKKKKPSIIIPPTDNSLKLVNKYIISSNNSVIGYNVLTDDTSAIQEFTLDTTKVVLVIYQANTVQGGETHWKGLYSAINVDGTDYAHSWDSPYNNLYTTRNCVFWAGVLQAGNHTVKGRLMCNEPFSTVEVENRVLIILIFDGEDYYYIDSANSVSTNSTTLIVDSETSFTHSYDYNSVLLVMYNAATEDSATEYALGKKVAISVDGTNYIVLENSPVGPNRANSIFTSYAFNLAANTQVTIQGMFASLYSDKTVTISRRQFAVLAFSETTLLDLAFSDTEASTTSNTLVDDTTINISKITTESREVFILATATKKAEVSSSQYGECYGISINDVDKTNSRSSPYNATSSNCISVCWAELLPAGSHIIKGRFCNNYNAETAKISSRLIIALWFTRE